MKIHSHYNTILTIHDWEDGGKQLVFKVTNTESHETKVFTLNIPGTDWSAEAVGGIETFYQSVEKAKKFGHGWIKSCIQKDNFESQEKTFNPTTDRINQYEAEEAVENFFQDLR